MNEEIIINDKDKIIWADPQERLKIIKVILKPKLIEYREKIERNSKSQFPQKINFIPAITNILDANLRKTPLVRYDYAICIDSETLQQFSLAYFDLMIFIRDYVPEFISNKQTFSAFCSFSTSVFNYLQNSQNGDIVAIMENIVDSSIDTNMSGAMGGSVSSSATFNRMKASGTAGYDVQIKSESEGTKNLTINVLDNDSITKRLQNMFGNNYIENKK